MCEAYAVKHIIMHRTLAMTTRYAHHYPESLRASVEVLDGCYNFTTMKVEAFDRWTGNV